MTNKQNLIIYKTADNKVSVALYVKDGEVWLNQNQLMELFATSKSSISESIKNILQNNELDENSVVRYFRTTAADNKTYEVKHYNLSMILAIGFRVRSVLGVQFRQWATNHLQEYLTKGFVMDDDRLKNLDSRPDYFDELLARIRDIRASEKRFYQKIRDLFALCIDYDSDDKATQMFFAQVQNKLLFAVTQNTAAEIIINRADADKKNNSGWLSFIYPRLKLTRDLLTDDGVIFISIDDNEQANLRILYDEIYLLANIEREFLEKYQNSKINLDGWADIDLTQYLNLDIKQNDNINVIY